MVKVDGQKKVVIITDHGVISNATFAFDEIKKLEQVDPELASKVMAEINSIESESKTEEDIREETVDQIRERVRDNKSRIELAFNIIINYNNKGGKENRAGFPWLVGIFKVVPENLYMTAWDDWSSGTKFDWNLSKDYEEFINTAKSKASDTTEVTIKDPDGKVIFYHRGPKY